jgi:hypothetical protein
MVAIQVTNSIGDTALLQVPVIVLKSNPMRPEILLKEQLVYLESGSSFDAASYLEALKVPGQNIPLSDVSISGDVDTEKAGTYYVYYSYASGNSVGTAILTVVVQ